jgi:hypothetical protein
VALKKEKERNRKLAEELDETMTMLAEEVEKTEILTDELASYMEV